MSIFLRVEDLGGRLIRTAPFNDEPHLALRTMSARSPFNVAYAVLGDSVSFAGRKTLSIRAEPYVSPAYVEKLKEQLQTFRNKKAIQRLIDHRWKIIVAPSWDGGANAQKVTYGSTDSKMPKVLPRAKTILLYEVQYHPELIAKDDSFFSQTDRIYDAVALALNYDIAAFPKQSKWEVWGSKWMKAQPAPSLIRISDHPLYKAYFEEMLQGLEPLKAADFLDHPAVIDKFGLPSYLQNYYAATDARDRFFKFLLTKLLEGEEEDVAERFDEIADLRDFVLQIYREYLKD